MGSMARLFDGLSTVGRRENNSRSSWSFLRLLRSGSPAWVPELDAGFLESRARQTVKCWLCFVCHASHDYSFELCAHLDRDHRQMTCLFALNPRLFPRCSICRKFSLFLQSFAVAKGTFRLIFFSCYFRLRVCLSGRSDVASYGVPHR